MPQFDVYRNPSKRTKDAYPYLVDVQNAVIDQLATRLVVPLTETTSRPNMMLKKLTPEINFEGKNYLFMTQQIASVPQEILKRPIGTLEGARTILIDAIDFAITGI
ncbi:CcdB family protein [Glaciecola sp. 1036]|uniref:CcdB family protein n=1 Tax=Alteromonadaceae TaxID=72275 RepID=UPI003D08551E